MESSNEEQWRELSERILTDIKEWRGSHPRATLAEIEDEVHRRMGQLEAQVIQDAARRVPLNTGAENERTSGRAVRCATRPYMHAVSENARCKRGEDITSH